MSMSIYEIFMKLMSRHLLSHLIAPLVLGVIVEIVFASIHQGSIVNFRDYLISWERFGLYAGILVSYLLIAGWFVNREATEPWRRSETDKVEDTLKDATDFFATCTIPLKSWFEPNVQQYLSHIVKGQLAGQKFRQQRVLLFFKDSALDNAKTQYLDGLYAKPLAELHKNYGITLGFLRPEEVNAILDECDCPSRDFAFVTHENPPYETVYLFKKERHQVKITRLKKPDDVASYKKLVDAIKQKVFVPGTDQLNVEHDFYAEVH